MCKGVNPEQIIRKGETSMKLKHKVLINVTDDKGDKQQVLKGATLRVPKKLLKWFIGEKLEILVLAPGQSVEDVEVHEIKKGT